MSKSWAESDIGVALNGLGIDPTGSMDQVHILRVRVEELERDLAQARAERGDWKNKYCRAAHERDNERFESARINRRVGEAESARQDVIDALEQERDGWIKRAQTLVQKADAAENARDEALVRAEKAEGGSAAALEREIALRARLKEAQTAGDGWMRQAQCERIKRESAEAKYEALLTEIRIAVGVVLDRHENTESADTTKQEQPKCKTRMDAARDRLAKGFAADECEEDMARDMLLAAGVDPDEDLPEGV